MSTPWSQGKRAHTVLPRKPIQKSTPVLSTHFVSFHLRQLSNKKAVDSSFHGLREHKEAKKRPWTLADVHGLPLIRLDHFSGRRTAIVERTSLLVL
jgi:hypothetical protein